MRGVRMDGEKLSHYSRGYSASGECLRPGFGRFRGNGASLHGFCSDALDRAFVSRAFACGFGAAGCMASAREPARACQIRAGNGRRTRFAGTSGNGHAAARRASVPPPVPRGPRAPAAWPAHPPRSTHYARTPRTRPHLQR